jgi:hypothetical protein
MRNFDLIGYFDPNLLTEMVVEISEKFLIFEKNHPFSYFFEKK